MAARHTATGRDVALEGFKSREDRLAQVAEARVLREVGGHRNVVTLLDVRRLQEHTVFVFPRANP